MIRSRYKVTFLSTLVSLVMLVAFVRVSPVVAVSSWDTTGSMTTIRHAHTATLLADGTVLVAGGSLRSDVLASAEVYDPLSGSWSATGSMTTSRYVHTATLLANGKVLVTGGSDGSFRLSSAEVYDPLSGSWSATAPMTTDRAQHTAVLLADGRVLVVGGLGEGGYRASAEVYDPLSGSWSATGSMTTNREGPTATLLPNGKVLVAGGLGDGGYRASAEVYDPLSGTWSATGSMSTNRYSHTATLLANGKVLVTGGYEVFGNHNSAELYDPLSGSWSATGSMTTNRHLHTATLLVNGTVLVAGGYGDVPSQASAELYDPLSGGWSATGSMSTAHSYHTATLLVNGTVLVAGGINDAGGVDIAELYGVLPGNSVPSLTSLDPNSAVAGGANFILTLNGTNFISSSIVRWNGSDRPTTYISSTQLSATISPADITAPGSASVTAFNPSPGGGASNALSFTILSPDQSSVAIDIKPGSPHNRINLKSTGKLSVAILSSATFDARQVNPRSVTLAGAPVIIKPNGRPSAQLKDVNGDSRRDLVVQVRIQDLQLTDTSTDAILNGMTSGNRAIQGKDKVSIVQPRGPELESPVIEQVFTKRTVKLVWVLEDKEEGAVTCYLVQTDKQEDFSSPEQSVVVVGSETYTTAPLPNGYYYWRVSVFDCSTTVISPWSETWSFIVRAR